MKYYNLNVKDVLKLLEANEQGLTNKEVDKRLKRDGLNKLKEEKRESNIIKFLNEFKDIMIIILILSSIVSFVLSLINHESFIDSIIIIAIVILNAILGFIQEAKAEKEAMALKNMNVTKVKVRRNNKLCVINSENVVKGDILVLEAGDTVPADARIIKEISLKVDESSLTGESLPVSKNVIELDEGTPLALRKNMIYQGTNIVYGKCEAVVCEVGMNTELGLIAESLSVDNKELTPLQKRINGISKFLSIVILIIIIIMFIIGLVKGMELKEVIMLAISLAVAAIPEGLPAVITIILSLGMNTLAKKKAIVRKMSSVETLGCTEVICSDKTGTITQNKMQVVEIYCNNKIMGPKDLEKDNILLKIMALNNDSTKDNNEFVGDPTEIALYECADMHIDVNILRENNIRIDEIPFDSERKMMSTVNKYNNEVTLYTKGSLDSVINRCSYILENGEVKDFTNSKKDRIKEIEKKQADKAYRILAYAYKNLNRKYNIDDEENELIFVGLSAMIDPPRVDVKESILACKSAHIKPVMITGDSLATAIAIAKDIGIINSNEEAITGIDIDNMSEDELVKNVNKYSVYARVSPMNKLSIVKAWKKNNKVVAMTGDGVNDAPALNEANIGVGMGITGTEVSKSVSDIILEDDSFSTIVTAVKEGRRIFDNIRNVLVYLLAGNITEVLVVFIGLLLGIEIFLPIQLLYINLITDSIPAIALAFEKEDDDVMKRNVRKSDGSFFTPFLIAKIAFAAIIKSIAIFAIFYINLKMFNLKIATSVAFLTLILLEMFFAFSCRNIKKRVLNKKIFKNGYLNKSMLLLIATQLIVFISPIKKIFNIADLNIMQVLISLAIVIIVFLIDEITKKIIVKLFKD